jgi:hypothetical protein
LPLHTRSVTTTNAGVVVFSKSYCPYCNASKSLLKEQGAKFVALELDLESTFLSPLLFYLRIYPFFTLRRG